MRAHASGAVSSYASLLDNRSGLVISTTRYVNLAGCTSPMKRRQDRALRLIKSKAPNTATRTSQKQLPETIQRRPISCDPLRRARVKVELQSVAKILTMKKSTGLRTVLRTATLPSLVMYRLASLRDRARQQ